MAAVLVAARSCETTSELHIAEDWYRRTALSDLLQLGDEEVNKDRLYRGLDHLLAYKSELEAHLSQRCGELFATQNEVLLYDVTSTYFEGQAAANPQAQRGYSRDHRPDCKQVCIALVVTFDGFPLGYEVFAGNTHDSRTLQTIVATMEARHGMLGRVWITDRGMASSDNLTWLRQTGRRYIIGAPKSELKKFASVLAAADGWRTVHEGVEEPRRSRQFATDHLGRTQTHSVPGRRPANRGASPDAPALCDSARPGSGHSPRSARHYPAKAHAPRRATLASSRTNRLIPNPQKDVVPTFWPRH